LDKNGQKSLFAPYVEHYVFECSKLEHAALYEKSKKNTKAYIQREGGN
jgi:hypothetical protein